MKEKLAKLVLSIFIATTFAIVVNASVVSISLEELTRNSDLIFVGKVISIKEIGEEKIAKVDILKTLKGNSQNSVFIAVSQTWACDVSDAVIDETALFFLGKLQIRPTLNSNLEKTCKFKKQVDSEIGKNDFYYISHSGSGRMPIEKLNGSENISILYNRVFLPKKIKVTEKPISKYSTKSLANLNEVIKETIKHSAKQSTWDLDDDNLISSDEKYKQVLTYRKMSDEEFDVVCKTNFVEMKTENCEPEELSVFEKIWNFIFG
jgi:hypothetical protein